MRVVDQDNFGGSMKGWKHCFFNLHIIFSDLFRKEYAPVHALGILGSVIMWHEFCHSYHHPEAQLCFC